MEKNICVLTSIQLLHFFGTLSTHAGVQPSANAQLSNFDEGIQGSLFTVGWRYFTDVFTAKRAEARH